MARPWHWLEREATHDPLAGPLPVRKTDLRGTRLLLVDGPETAMPLCLRLQQEGFTVRVAHTAEEALILVTTFLPHAIVANLVLPQMSGLVLLSQINRDRTGRGIVTIALSAIAGEDVERIALGAGCSAYFHVPVDADALVRRLSGELRRTD